MSDYYQLLGVADDADIATIKRAYRQKIAHHHPDRHGGDADDEMVRRLNLAYATLKDNDARADYDRQLRKRRQQRWLDDKRTQLATVVVSVARQFGKIEPLGTHRHFATAKAANQAAKVVRHLQNIWHKMADAATKPTADAICQISLSTAYQGGQVAIVVAGISYQATLPKGLGDGEIISVHCAGVPVRIQIKISTPSVQIIGSDVHYTVNLSQTQAKNGTSITLPEPLSLRLAIPPKGSYPAKIVLHGQGLPLADTAGDFIVCLQVDA
ncbi:J domain-containing protein [Moraxella marmotae]|uniref:J domain-containing protein n=1 Tax=Moraxella marmotae TaxID=3344520 RepID=UPI0035F2E903